MIDVLTNNSDASWTLYAALFLGAVAFLAVVRWVETRRMRRKLENDDIILLSFGVNMFGCESDTGSGRDSSGALALTKNELYYRARFSKKEVTVPGRAIARLAVTDQFRGAPLRRHAIAIDFINEKGQRDRAVLRIPHPAKWIQLMNAMFLDKKAAAEGDDNTQS